MNKKSITYSAIIIMTFLLAFFGKRILSDYLIISVASDFLKIAYYYSWWLLPTVLITGILYGFDKLADSIGINKGFITGLLFSLLCVLPMLISSAVIGHSGADLKFTELIHKTLIAGFMEEYLFRGFLFGLLFRKSGWGFIPASLAGALIFGSGHLYQGTSIAETAGIFFVTAMGAVWFAWLYIEWNNNLWVPVFLHILMNLSWSLFDVSNNAFGGFYSNIFRMITIALTIIITVRYHKKTGLKVNRRNLFVSNTHQMTS